MLGRFINWRARTNGINWYTAAERGAPDIEQGGKALTAEEQSFLLSVEKDMPRTYRGIPVVPGVSAERWVEVRVTPPPPRRAELPGKSTLYVVLAVFAAVGAYDMADRGQVLPCLGFVVLAWLASKWAVEAYPGKHGQ